MQKYSEVEQKKKISQAPFHFLKKTRLKKAFTDV
jgi:hypothetical protein